MGYNHGDNENILDKKGKNLGGPRIFSVRNKRALEKLYKKAKESI